MWLTNDSKWKTSIRPSSLELKELGGEEPSLNQCIGVVISSLRLDDATWQANFEPLPSPQDQAGSRGRPRGASGGDGMLLVNLSSIYTDTLPLSRLCTSAPSPLMELISLIRILNIWRFSLHFETFSI